VSSISTIPPALLAIALATGVIVLGLGLLALARSPAGRHRTAWQFWSAALGLDVVATTIGMVHRLADIGIPPGVVESIVALAAALAALGVIARLPTHAVAASHLVLDQVPLVLAVVAVASVTYGGVVDDSLGHIATHVVGPAAFTVLAAICFEAIHYVGGANAPRSAKLLTLGFLLTALAGISPAFVADPAVLAYPRVVIWVAGLVAIGAGAAMRARHPGKTREYAPRLDPISGWSWGAVLGVVVLVLLVLFHRGPEDDFRLVAAVLALATFAARSTMARRQGIHLMADLHSADTRYRALVEQIPLAIYTTGLGSTGTAKYISPAIEQLLGYTPDEVEGDADWFRSVLHPEDRWVLDAVGEWYEMRSGDGWEQEFRAVAKDGSVRWVRDRAVIIRDESGAPLHAQGFMQDVTARKHAEAGLRESERRYRDTLEGVNLLALQLDLDGVVTFCNDHVCEVTGWSRDELVGRNWYETVGPVERQDTFLDAVRADDLEDGSEERLRTAGGGDRVILWWDTVSRDDSGTIIGVNSIGQDVTERRHAEERLAFLRYHDELTGLPNRMLFTDRLARAIGHASERGRCLGVIFVNLENFRVVNDAFGQAVGDAVLCQFANRLREAAHGAALVARHGEDEFIILLADMADDAASSSHVHPADVAQMAAAIGGRVRHVLRRPFVHAGHELFLSARSGAAVFPVEGENVDDLLKTAHGSAYRTPVVSVARPGDARSELAPREELDLIARLHHAIDHGEFLLHYQPLVDLCTGAVVGTEALIRWQPPGQAMVPPNQFIPVAERTGLIAPITHWVIDQVSAQRAEWRRRGIDVPISFNFPLGLWDQSTLLNMLAAMRRHGLAPGDLVVEVTESAAVMDTERSAGAIEVVREHGIRLAIDDFGTGYSSLARLGRLPVSVLKVDRSFVRGLPHERTSAELTRHIVGLAHGLGMLALAEGIETEEQRRCLADLGCDLGQGFLFARPMPAADIEAMLDTRRKAA
jgi:diguanylate cyclase (GGDEF)-like protein/PAS domain S-box-containing protein